MARKHQSLVWGCPTIRLAYCCSCSPQSGSESHEGIGSPEWTLGQPHSTNPMPPLYYIMGSHIYLSEGIKKWSSLHRRSCEPYSASLWKAQEQTTSYFTNQDKAHQIPRAILSHPTCPNHTCPSSLGRDTKVQIQLKRPGKQPSKTYLRRTVGLHCSAASRHCTCAW